MAVIFSFRTLKNKLNGNKIDIVSSPLIKLQKAFVYHDWWRKLVTLIRIERIDVLYGSILTWSRPIYKRKCIKNLMKVLKNLYFDREFYRSILLAALLFKKVGIQKRTYQML